MNRIRPHLRGRALPRLLAALLLPLMLTGCFKGQVVSTVDKKGNVRSEVQFETNILFAGMYEEQVKRLRARGIDVDIQMSKEGIVRMSWAENGWPLGEKAQWKCRGLFSTECTLNFRDALPEVPPQMQALMSEMRRKKAAGDKTAQDLYPELRLFVVLPENAKIKSTDASKQFTDMDGQNLEWDVDFYKGSFVNMNFTVQM